MQSLLRTTLVIASLATLGCSSVEVVDNSVVIRPGQAPPELSVADIGELELLSAEAERSRYAPPGELPVAVRNDGLFDVEITGWVLRLDSGSRPARLRLPSVLLRAPHADRDTAAPGEAVSLIRPY